MARPSVYSEELADRICDEIATGNNLNKLCALDDFPGHDTVFRWLLNKPEFSEKYARAREKRADVRSDRADGIKQALLDGKIDANSARVAFDIERWQAGKENPKRYGDRIENRLAGPEGEALKIVVTGIRPTPENSE